MRSRLYERVSQLSHALLPELMRASAVGCAMRSQLHDRGSTPSHALHSVLMRASALSACLHR
jgi:hypothetical protein